MVSRDPTLVRGYHFQNLNGQVFSGQNPEHVSFREEGIVQDSLNEFAIVGGEQTGGYSPRTSASESHLFAARNFFSSFEDGLFHHKFDVRRYGWCLADADKVKKVEEFQ